jgi:hypothetical protein
MATKSYTRGAKPWGFSGPPEDVACYFFPNIQHDYQQRANQPP